VSEEPRITKPEDFFDEVTRDIQIDSDPEEPTRVVTKEALEDAELPTQIGIPIEEITRVGVSLDIPRPPPSEPPPSKISNEELDFDIEKILSAPPAGAPSILAPTQTSEPTTQTNAQIRAPKTSIMETYRAKLWQANRNVIVIAALLVAACTALLISVGHRKSLESVDLTNSSGLTGPWSLNLERPLIEFHSEAKTWTDLEKQIDSAVQELDNHN
jgi:hypothetical protein